MSKTINFIIYFNHVWLYERNTAMAKGLSPVQRTLRVLREQGAKCSIVEHFNPHVGEHGVRQDLFGIIDILALDPSGIIGIQVCGSDYKKHFNKLTIERAQDSIDWLSCRGTKLQIWSWRQLKIKRGSKAVKWTPKVTELSMEDFGDKRRQS